MTRRAAVVLAGDVAPDLQAGPPDPATLRLAFFEDVYEVLAGLELLDAGAAVPADHDRHAVVALTWPGAPVVDVPGGPQAGNPLVAALAGLDQLGYHEAVVVALDAPDLPGLLVGKLFRALGRAEVAACPAERGGLVAIAARLPLAAWAVTAGVDLDTPDASDALRAATPARAAVGVTSGWHRVRTPRDLAALDPGLEGWAATRSLCTTLHPPSPRHPR